MDDESIRFICGLFWLASILGILDIIFPGIAELIVCWGFVSIISLLWLAFMIYFPYSLYKFLKNSR